VLKWHNRKEKELLDQLEAQLRDLEQIKRFVLEGVSTDGAHHKQWYLCEIGLVCGLTMDFSDAVAP
jgi:hypothetical protein